MQILSSLKKLILVTGICLPVFINAQTPQKVKPNWQNLDLKSDSVFGIGTEKAYHELLKDKKHVPVVVAVIDGGVDINHEDLKQVIWTNPKEIAGNNADDDKNGYIDDIHGWDFIGSSKGNVQYDNLELTRLVRLDKAKFDHADTAHLQGADREEFDRYRKMREDLGSQLQKATRTYEAISKFNDALNDMVGRMNLPSPAASDFKSYMPQSNTEIMVRNIMVDHLGEYPDLATFRKEQIDGALKHFREQVYYHLNLNYSSRDIVGDNYPDANEHFYGNSDVTGPDADHGTHVAGIIGAIRTNDLGIMGVANDVMIMSVRTVPTGDERDKDVANAIHYAAANGAKVINMSFGKAYSYNKQAVDEAVKFAMSKDVLIVHAAGNDNENLDKVVRYPNRTYEDKSGIAGAWIDVGASGPTNDETLKASFSNYGQTSVDVFAPGVKIYSTTPNSTYANHDGTSMAAPVVTGLAALIRSYYPKLTALQVKEIIMQSVVKVDHKITIRDKDGERRLAFAKLCSSGGIVNAYNALKLAETYSPANTVQ